MKSILYLTTLCILVTILLSSCGGKVGVTIRVLGAFEDVEDDLFICTADRITDAPYANSTETSNDCGTVDIPCTICTGLQFNTIGANSADWSKYFSLKSNISLAAYDHTSYNRIGTNNGTHAYSANTPFLGVFDGEGHIISGFTFEDDTIRYIGLFGYIGTGGVVKNIILHDISIQGMNGIGGIAGEIWNGEVDKVTVTGTILATASAGCVAGDSIDGSITKSISDCIVISTGSQASGILGAGSGAASSVSNSYATGNVTGAQFIGGILGIAMSGYSVSKSYATGNISGTRYVGGVAGAYSAVTDSFFTGNIQGDSANSEVGLATGFTSPTNAHVSGDATCTNIGAGTCAGESGTIQANDAYFYDSANNPMNTWDFVNDWQEVGDSTPILR